MKVFLKYESSDTPYIILGVDIIQCNYQLKVTEFHFPKNKDTL